VRMFFTAILAAVTSEVLLWRDGAWLLVATIPGSLAYIAYRGAVVTAQEYGVAMMALIDLNRFAFYERLHLPRPSSITVERKTNERLMKLLEANSKHISMRYEHPSPSGESLPPSG
jgi:hypothetical protein